MKKFWQKLTGPSGWLSPAHIDKGVGVILTPFLVLMLLLAQIGDVLNFTLKRLAGLSARMYDRMVVAIDRTKLSLQVKYVLMQVFGWLPTGLLIMLACAVAGSWVAQVRQNQKQADELAMKWAVAQENTSDELLAPPDTVKIASETAIVLIDEDKLEEKTKLLELNQAELSQTDMVNLSLLYYYLGRLEQYQSFLDKARRMDPNSELFDL